MVLAQPFQARPSRRRKLQPQTWQTVCHQGYTWHQEQGCPSTLRTRGELPGEFPDTRPSFGATHPQWCMPHKKKKKKQCIIQYSTYHGQLSIHSSGSLAKIITGAVITSTFQLNSHLSSSQVLSSVYQVWLHLTGFTHCAQITLCVLDYFLV